MEPLLEVMDMVLPQDVDANGIADHLDANYNASVYRR